MELLTNMKVVNYWFHLLLRLLCVFIHIYMYNLNLGKKVVLTVKAQASY